MARQTKAQARQQRRLEAETKRRAEARARTFRIVGVGAAILVALGVLLAVTWPAPDEGNTTADAWDLPQLDGEGRVRLADFRGKPMVAAFFANWCEVCEHEIPELLALSQSIGDQVQFVGIDMMDNGQGLGDARKWGIVGEWPLARDIGNGNGSSLSALTFGARGSPLNVVYDADGQVVQVIRGGIAADQLVDLLIDNGLLES